MADALAQDCPPVGGPHRQRLSRLRARLAFDSSAAAIEESAAVASRELQEYAAEAALYVERHRLELRRALAGLEDIVRTIGQRQDFYSARLRQFAVRTERSPSPATSENLLSCVESLSHESQSLLKRMRDEMARVETRLTEAEITDPVTGLMNRREMERRIEAVRAAGESPVLLMFEFQDDLPGEVAREVGSRLGNQFRHHDLISRWDDRRFLVLFHGSAETARSRAEQVEPWISGRYLIDSGAPVEIVVQVRLVEAPLAELEPVPVPVT